MFDALSAEFPKERIHWRAQTVRKDGTAAMALAYIDARDVMERLDGVCGQENWQDEYWAADGKTCCRLGIRIKGEWIWKSDGAGDTDIEGDKGAFSGALKRAAVKWGVGRYLYDMKTPWVPCESYKGRDDKWKFSKFTADPWQYVEKTRVPMLGKFKKQELEKRLRALVADISGPIDGSELAGIKESYKDEIKQCHDEHSKWWHGDEQTPGLAWHLTQAETRVQQMEAKK